MSVDRRSFLRGASMATALVALGRAYAFSAEARKFQFVQVDVFTSRRLEGNALAVFPDARGLSDKEMQDLARETNLQETTFVFPRAADIEREQGVQVRIFTSDQELPFGGHPALGTAMVLRNRRTPASTEPIVLDLKVGKVPVTFRQESDGLFGEMQQVGPVFGPVHDRAAIAAMLGLSVSDLVEDWPIQTVSTGVAFATVPLKQLSSLQSLRPDFAKVAEYAHRQPSKTQFYYVTPDTGESGVRFRARFLFPSGEDAATGSAAGSAAGWMVRHGIAKPEESVHILQGAEMKRPSHLFVRAGKQGDEVVRVRVGGHAVETVEATVSL